MTIAEKPKPDIDRRRYRRLKLALGGRLMLPDRSEFPCKVVDLSPGNVAFSTAGMGRIGERVIAYVNGVGRLDGVISRMRPDGFALDLRATPYKQTELIRQLTRLKNTQALNRPEERRFDRVAPRNPAGILHLEDGSQHRCNVIDLSPSGAAVEVNVTPPLGSHVALSGTRGRVVRHIQGGITVEFAVAQHYEDLKPFLR